MRLLEDVNVKVLVQSRVWGLRMQLLVDVESI